MQMRAMFHLLVGGAIVAVLASFPGCGTVRNAERPALTQPVVPGIYSVKPDGSHLELLVQRPSITVSSFLASPDRQFRTGTTSPDGQSLAYMDRDGGREVVWLLNVASRETRQLATFDELLDLEWAPEGTAIAALGHQGAQSGLFVLAADTGELRHLLSACLSYRSSLSWAPGGKQLALSGVGAAEEPPSAAGPNCVDAKFELKAVTLDTKQVITLGEGADPAWSPDGNTVAFIRGEGLYRQSFPPEAQPVKLADRAVSPSWSPDGRTLAFSRSDGVYTIAADGKGSEVQVADGEAPQPKWAPDGRSITFVRSGEVFVVATDGRKERSVASSPFPFLDGADWLDDDRILFSLAAPTDSGVYLANPDGSGQKYAAPGEGPLAWSPDGRQVSFRMESSSTGFATSGSVYVLDPERTKILYAGSIFFFTDSLGPCDGSRIAWSPDSSRIAFSGPQSGTEVFDVSHETQGEELKGMYLPNWSQDGTTLVVQVEQDGWCQISFKNLETGESRQIAKGSRPTWSPDGKWVAFEDRFDGLTVFGAQSAEMRVVGPRVQELVWSPDSTKLAFVDAGHIFVADVASGGSPQEVAKGQQLAWSPDGRTLAFAETFLAPGYYAPCGAIAVVDVESAAARELAAGGAHPQWSPDGKLLVFEAGNAIYAVTPDAPAAPTLLVEGSTIAFSPDGAQISFVRRHGTANPIGPPVCPETHAFSPATRRTETVRRNTSMRNV